MTITSHSFARLMWRASALLVVLIALAAPVAAATSTWTGSGGTPYFSNAGNWDAVPTADCIMVFPSGQPFTSQSHPVNNMSGLTINQLNISEDYVISGNAIVCKNINDSSAGTVNVSLPIATAGSAVLTITVSTNGATLNLSGKLSGAGPVTYSGLGNKRLNGTINNTVSGLSIVAQGFLVLDSTASESIAGPLQINSGATARLVSVPEIKNSVPVTVNGILDLSAATGNDGAVTELIGGLRGTDTSANVALGANTLGCAAQVGPTNYLGGFSGTGGFRQSASGIEVLSGTAFPYTGTTTLVGGSIHIWGQLIGSPVVVTGGTLVLANDASVGAVTLSSAASVLSLDETISAMAMHATTPSLTVGSGSTYLIVARSPTNYSTISTAAASINGAVLVVDTSHFTPGVASVMTIINNTGSNPVSGTFAGLAEGATVTSASNTGTTFTISYIGGSGNDVTLTGVTVATDITAPAISAVTAGSITGNSVTVTWTTNETATSQVEYGLTTAYGSMTTRDATLVLSHSVAVTGLMGSTLYHYRVLSRDAAGNLATSADATVTTAVDTTAPVISAVSVDSVTGTTAVISWTTDEVSDSQVEYGLTTAYGSTTTIDTSMVTAHSVPVTGLALSTLYHYRALSTDASGNTVTGADGTFTTTDGSVPVAINNDSNNKCGSGGMFSLLGLALLLSLSMGRTARCVEGAQRSSKH